MPTVLAAPIEGIIVARDWYIDNPRRELTYSLSERLGPWILAQFDDVQLERNTNTENGPFDAVAMAEK